LKSKGRNGLRPFDKKDFASGWDAKRLLEENRVYKNDVRLRGQGTNSTRAGGFCSCSRDFNRWV
jgi:hypothetical protein